MPAWTMENDCVPIVILAERGVIVWFAAIE
jgi:hypothetical protein